MRLTQYSLIFFVILIPIAVAVEIKLNTRQAEHNRGEEVVNCIEMSVEEAGSILCTEMPGAIEDLRGMAVNTFFQTAYAYMGIMEDEDAKEKLNQLIPIICVTDVEGYYLRYVEDGRIVWTELIPYFCEDDRFIYRFVGKNKALIYTKDDSQPAIWKEGDLGRTDVRVIPYDEMEASGFDLEELQKKMAGEIVSRLEAALTYYGSRHITYTRQQGIQYNIAIPEEDNSDFIRSMGGRGIIVLYKYDGLSNDGRIFMARSGVRGGDGFWIDETGEYPVYHTTQCKNEMASGEQMSFYVTAKECAMNGAYACEICIPFGIHAPIK